VIVVQEIETWCFAIDTGISILQISTLFVHELCLRLVPSRQAVPEDNAAIKS